MLEAAAAIALAAAAAASHKKPLTSGTEANKEPALELRLLLR